MLIPTNATAEAIVKMQQQNFGYQSQIETLTALLEDNERLILELSPDATWQEVEDPDVSDTNPEDGLLPTPFPPPTDPEETVI